MNQNDLAPAKQFARQFGAKMVVYGKAGAAKTPVCVNTAPNPVLLASEPGMLTLKGSECPTYPAFNPQKIDEFMAWFCGSHEAKGRTLIWDSASQSAEKKVEVELSGKTQSGNDAHGKRAYGNMSRWMMDHLNKLYFLPERHIILITKLDRAEINGTIYHRPYFPGKELNIRVPHLFDLVTCLGEWAVPGVTPTPPATGTRAFRTQETYDYMGRDRSGALQIYEPPNVAAIIAKFMA